ncbi:MAG: MerR family transcriptional regulator [Actinobacteria bacterium]|nr:MerR family transcriptional regulator [Actinomycetota bacterium]
MAAKRDYMTIGRVVETLRPRFPDLSISKVRFLEDERLVKPSRTGGGYRKFTQRDVNRLELALRLQKERYLPLNVIRQTLDSMTDEQIAVEVTGGAYEGNGSSYVEGEGEPLPVDKAIGESGLTQDQVRLLEDYGVIKAVRTSEGKFYSAVDVEVMSLAREMARFGIEPRHLRMYGTLVDREIALFQQIIAPLSRQRTDDGQRRRAEVIGQLSDISNQFKRLLLKRMVQEHILVK